MTEAAISKRRQRGSMNREMGELDKVYVYRDSYENTSYPELQVDHIPLVRELRDRLRFLELDRRSLETGRYQQILAGRATANANLTNWLKDPEALPYRSQCLLRRTIRLQEGLPGTEKDIDIVRLGASEGLW